jgi:hypothetical protein
VRGTGSAYEAVSEAETVAPASAARRGRPPLRARLRGLPRDGVHLLVLSTFALAQPLFAVLSNYPEFFAAHDSTPLEIVAFALVVMLVPPALLLLVEALAGLVSDRLRAGAHLVFVGALAAATAVPALKRVDERLAALPTVAILVGALVVGAAAVLAYARLRPVRAFLTVLAPAPALFLAWFLLLSPIARLTLEGVPSAYGAKVGSPAPVVMVVFDAFPSSLLMDGKRRIDAARYPNFAALALDSTWYRNATTVHENTIRAVPATVDGDMPEGSKLPIAADHRNSLFTLLGRTYRMTVSEDATNLCPADLCGETERESFKERMELLASDIGVLYSYLLLPDQFYDRLPSITDRWRDFHGRGESGGRGDGAAGLGGDAGAAGRLYAGRPQRFQQAVATIEPRSRPTLDFMHFLLPHGPFQYLPSGRSYDTGDLEGSLEAPASYDNEWLTQQALQRHLLQAGFVDRLVGRLLDRLHETGLYDEALIVITADHGQSYRVKGTAPSVDSRRAARPLDALGIRGAPGELGYRRKVTEENIHELAPVPLFVKAPSQRAGRIDDSYVRTIDILPTIADLLDVDMPFETDGRSALADAPERGSVEMIERSGDKVRIDIPTFGRRRVRALVRQLALFGSGRGRPGPYGIGPHRELLGRRLADLPVASRDDARAEVLEESRLRSVDLRSPTIPALLTGRIAGERPGGRALAVALNGRIRATCRSFPDLGPPELNFSALLPEWAFREGANRVEILEVLPGARLLRLTRLGRT